MSPLPPDARVRALEGHERRIRIRAHRRAVAPLAQQPHEFQTPIPHRYRPAPSGDHMLAPGSVDDTGFAPGCVV